MFAKKNHAQSDELEMFVVFDSKSGSYREPIIAENADVVLRDLLNMFRAEVSKDLVKRHPWFANAEDYSMFRAGRFSKTTGRVTGVDLSHVSNFHDLRSLALPSPGIVPT